MTEEEIIDQINNTPPYPITRRYLGRVLYDGKLYHTTPTTSAGAAKYLRRLILKALKYNDTTSLHQIDIPDAN